jgi:hypothetical protein
MKDLEFISTKEVILRRVVLYEGSSFDFINEVVGKIECELKDRGHQIFETDLDGFSEHLSSVIFEKNLFVFDLRGLYSNNEDLQHCLFKELATVGGDLVRTESRILLILDREIKGWDKFVGSDIYKELRKESNVIEEVTYSKHSFEGILKKISGILGIPETFTNKDLFISAMEQMWGSLECVGEFYKCVEFCYNSFFIAKSDSAEFDVESCRRFFDKKKDKEYFVLHKLLGSFISRPDQSSSGKLVEFLFGSEMFRSSPRAVVDTLYKVIFDLIYINEGMKKSDKIQGISDFKMSKISKYSVLSLEGLIRFLPRFSQIEPLLQSRHTFICNLTKLFIEFEESEHG